MPLKSPPVTCLSWRHLSSLPKQAKRGGSSFCCTWTCRPLTRPLSPSPVRHFCGSCSRGLFFLLSLSVFLSLPPASCFFLRQYRCQVRIKLLSYFLNICLSGFLSHVSKTFVTKRLVLYVKCEYIYIIPKLESVSVKSKPASCIFWLVCLIICWNIL